MLEGKKEDYYIDLTKPSPHPWTTLGPLDGNRPQKSATNYPSDTAANPNNQLDYLLGLKPYLKTI